MKDVSVLGDCWTHDTTVSYVEHFSCATDDALQMICRHDLGYSEWPVFYVFVCESVIGSGRPLTYPNGVISIPWL